MYSHSMKRLLNQSVALSRYAVSDDSCYHEPVYQTPVTVPARVEYVSSSSFGRDGKIIPSYALVYLRIEVYPHDRITLPDGTSREVVTAKRMHDGDGRFSHSEVTV